MNTHIVLNDDLVKLAFKMTKLNDVQKLIELALKELIANKKPDALSRAFGQYHWEGDLDEMRTDKNVSY